MTNKEYYRDLLADIALDVPSYTGNVGLSKVSGKPFRCNHLSCDDCVFNKKRISCSFGRKEWAEEEYSKKYVPDVDWASVSTDTPVLISIPGDFIHRHFASYDSSTRTIYTYVEGRTSWTSEGVKEEYKADIVNLSKEEDILKYTSR